MKNENKLIGKYFHTIKNEEIQHQGKILEVLPNGLILVQLYNFIMGEESIKKLININTIKEWIIYDTDKEMREYYKENKK